MNLDAYVAQVGLAAAIITTVYSGFGLPVQVRKNYLGKSVEGTSLVMTVLQLFTFSSWVLYAAIKTQPDWYVIVSNAPGAVCDLLILWQFALYSKAKAVPSLH